MTEIYFPRIASDAFGYLKETDTMTGQDRNERPSDELLVAFADGTLDGAERARVERYLETDEEARELVEQLRHSARLAVEAFDDVLNAPPPAGLVDKILARPSQQQHQGGKILPFERPARRVFRVSSFAMQAAAGIALVAAVSLYAMRSQPGSQEFTLASGPVDRDSALGQLLETKASGDPIEIERKGAKPVEVVVSNTFLDGQSRPCREFEAVTPGALTVAVACRADGAAWTVEGVSRVAQATPVPGDEFSPASGGSGSAMEEILAKLGARPPMSAVDEKSLLGRGWK